MSPATQHSESPLSLQQSVFHNTSIFLHFNTKKVHTEIDIAHYIRKGLPFKTIETICKELNLSQQELYHYLRLNERTMARRKKEHKLQADESDRIYRLAKIFALAIFVLEDKKFAVDWLSTPKTVLGGEIPLALLDTEAGTNEVTQLLGRIEYGVFA